MELNIILTRRKKSLWTKPVLHKEKKYTQFCFDCVRKNSVQKAIEKVCISRIFGRIDPFLVVMLITNHSIVLLYL